MDGRQFDALSRAVASASTRRGIVRILSVVPLLGVLFATVRDEPASAGRSQKSRRRKGNDREDVHANRRIRGEGKNKKHKRNKKSKSGKKQRNQHCKPQSAARICFRQCGEVLNNCGDVIDCGPCDCGVCPVCQVCDAETGLCQANPAFRGEECGSPGQSCQANGACTCDDGSCLEGQRCNGIVCTCDATSCPNGCCDGNRVCRINEDAACGTGGAVCNRCEAECVDGACTCSTACPPCQGCNQNTGFCRPDAGTDGDPCGTGEHCQGGQCVCDQTSCPNGCCDGNACRIEEAEACGTGGGTCRSCTTPGQACEAGDCCAEQGSTVTVNLSCCTGLNKCNDGVCRADCCTGVTCTADPCDNPGICDPGTGLCSSPMPKNVGDPCGSDGKVCQPDGTCRCIPACNGKVCGPDGCGTTCGACDSGQICTAAGQCCTPTTCAALYQEMCRIPGDCDYGICGSFPDGCGGTLDCGGCNHSCFSCDSNICTQRPGSRVCGTNCCINQCCFSSNQGICGIQETCLGGTCCPVGFDCCDARDGSNRSSCYNLSTYCQGNGVFCCQAGNTCCPGEPCCTSDAQCTGGRQCIANGASSNRGCCSFNF